ncbi:MAG: hypothetical protein ACM3RQ_00580 [Methanocella sp.]
MIDIIHNRFTEAAEKIQRDARAKDGAVEINALLKEEAPEFLLDAKILTAAARASVLSGQAWVRHDLEHNPRNTANRLRSLQVEMDELHQLIDPLAAVRELDGYAKECISELSWFSQKIWNRDLAKEVARRSNPEAATSAARGNDAVPTVLVWKTPGYQLKSVIGEVKIGEA